MICFRVARIQPLSLMPEHRAAFPMLGLPRSLPGIVPTTGFAVGSPGE
uniref:Uncharacterized protein n=1 Tax=Physcomitrium patens TaxID=3218 RepID=A0A2K1JJ16_PHYPA|nr:hypothetical protein PHYPA_018932 [Physcomitrium patens]